MTLAICIESIKLDIFMNDRYQDVIDWYSKRAYPVSPVIVFKLLVTSQFSLGLQGMFTNFSKIFC
jgi:hypothetical protein